jgi:hypothetical protein
MGAGREARDGHISYLVRGSHRSLISFAIYI